MPDGIGAQVYQGSLESSINPDSVGSVGVSLTQLSAMRSAGNDASVHPTSWEGYAVAIGCVVVAIAARALLDPVVGSDIPYITFFLPVVLAGWYGGLGPAITAALLGGIAAWVLFVPPRFSLSVARSADVLGLIVYFIVTLTMAGFSGTMRGIRRRSRSAERSPLPQGEIAERQLHWNNRDAEAMSRQLAAIVESSEDAIISKDLTGIVTSWNRAATRMFGYSAEEMIGQSILRIIPAERVAEEPEILSRIQQGRQVDHFETIRRRSDGQLFPVSLTISPIRAPDGRVIGVSKIARDITQQTQTAEALREADRHKNEFIALLAHELRNPLASISNALQIVEQTDGETPTTVIMQRQLAQMVRLIDDLLDVSRISRGKVELKPDRIDLANVIHDAVAAAQSFCDRLGHMLTLSLPPAPIFVFADANRLTQVIGNLLDNACKFTPRSGHIWLTVEQEGDSVVIRVRDNGIGMVAEQIPQMFEMFRQADASLERTQNGLGLGLTLAKNLVEMHGGTIQGSSDGLGKGSEFVVRLPVVEAPHAPQEASPNSASAVSQRILVVDDNRDAADSLALLLQLSGHTVRTAYDGAEAIRTAAEFEPDVILLDIGLPKLNGYEVARRIRQQPGGQRARLVALTGWGQEEDRFRSGEAGFDVHLVKPLDHEALARILARWAPSEPGSHA